MNIKNLPDPDQRSSTEIQSGIRDTRQRMNQTLDDLGQRLTPRSLLNTAMDWWDENSSAAAGKSRAKKTYRIVSQQVKKHPAPSLLIGTGLAWLFLNSEDDDETPPSSATMQGAKLNRPETGDAEPSTLDRIADKWGGAREAVSGSVDSVKDKAEGMMEGAGEWGDKAGELYTSGKQTAKDKFSGGVEMLRGAMDDYPLAMGAAFLALGALAGVVLPPTRREDAMLGAKSDEIVSEIKEKGGELVEQGKEKAAEMGDELLTKAREQGITTETVGEKLTQLTTGAGEAMRHAAEAVAGTIRDKTAEGPEPRADSPHGFGNNMS